MKKYYLLLLIISITFGACDDFLDEAPNNSESVEIKTIEHLERLLNDYETFGRESNSDAIFGSDDFGLVPGLHDAIPDRAYAGLTANYATWDINYVKDDLFSYFQAEWKKVFIANLVLENLKSIEGDEATKEDLKAEAHFIRAYSYYQMVNTYCLPYSQANLNEMGLPIKKGITFNEDVSRASLKETWDFILEDLGEALKMDKDLEPRGDNFRSWRASIQAVNAFAARVYLMMHDYTNAQLYAQKALDGHSQLVDYNTGMSYYVGMAMYFENGRPNRVNIEYPFTYTSYDPDQQMAWNELYYYRFMVNGRFNYWPSAELLAVYDQANDLRYQYHVVEDYSLTMGAVGHPRFGKLYKYPGYIFFSNDRLPSGPTVGEMLLIKAECQARLGNWTEGLNTANVLRAARIASTAPAETINLSASSQDEALSELLKERRRELPFTQRFFDIRRYNSNDNPNDDVVITRSFFPVSDIIEGTKELVTYTLEKNSRKYARPIPNKDINSSEGALKQNTY